MYLVIDIGGTKTRFAVTNNLDEIENPILIETNQDFDAHKKQLFEEVSKASEGKAITAITCGIPGTLKGTPKEIVRCPHLPLWAGVAIEKELSDLFKAKAYIDNDTALVGLGEAVAGAGKGKSIVVYVTVSTGVNGVRIVDGTIEKSAYGFEIGHHYIDGDRDWESFISGSAMKERFGEEPKEIRSETVWEEENVLVAKGLANVMMFWSPDIIVLGGSMVKDMSMPRILEELRKLTPMYNELPLLTQATLGEFGGLYGGLAYIRTHVLA